MAAIAATKKVKKSGADKAFQFMLYLLSIALLILVVYPLYFVVIASFSDPSAVASGQVWLWPKEFTLDGYEEILGTGTPSCIRWREPYSQ